MTGRPTTDDIQQLRDAAEQKAGRRMHTPKDFDFLRERIYEECHEMVSISTLKRLWGYDRYEGTPRVSSLNPIARYVGYSDWDDYLQHAVVNEEQTDQPEQDAQEIKENTPHTVILSPTYILAATFFMAVVIGGIALLKRFSSGEQTASSVEDTIPPSGQRVLRKGQDCFHTIDDYLALFGIEARDTAYFCPLPGNRDVYLWGRNTCTPYGTTRETPPNSCPLSLNTGLRCLANRSTRTQSMSNWPMKNYTTND